MALKFIKTPIDGLLVIEPKVFGDSRGYFFESYVEEQFKQNLGDVRFVQDNESCSTYGVVRGLHFQRPPHTQSKLVRAVSGHIRDVVVDLRAASPTYGEAFAVDLTGENHRQLFVPRGFAHGFSVLSDTAIVQYKCDSYYCPESEGGIAWNDPCLNIDWGVERTDVVLSAKDSDRMLFADFVTPF